MSTDQSIVFFLAAVAATALLAVVLVLVIWLAERQRDQARIQQLLQDRDRSLVEARRESVEKSRSSLKGRIAEQLAPLLTVSSTCLPMPASWATPSTTSYSTATRACATRPRDRAMKAIVLLEVKQGKSALSTFQRAIARSVEDGRVRFEVCRVSEDGTVATETWRPRRQGKAPVAPQRNAPTAPGGMRLRRRREGCALNRRGRPAGTFPAMGALLVMAAPTLPVAPVLAQSSRPLCRRTAGQGDQPAARTGERQLLRVCHRHHPRGHRGRAGHGRHARGAHGVQDRAGPSL